MLQFMLRACEPWGPHWQLTWLFCCLLHTERCSIDAWEALLVLAAVGDALDDTGPAKAWEVLQVRDKMSLCLLCECPLTGSTEVYLHMPASCTAACGWHQMAT